MSCPSAWLSLDRRMVSSRRVLMQKRLSNLSRALERLVVNRFVEWTHNGGQSGRHSSMPSAPLRAIHGQR